MDNSHRQRPPCAAVGKCRRGRVDEDDVGDPPCTGKSCQSCTAGAIADCVAVCCCPCAVVNILALALVKLPWAVARRFLDGRRRRRRLDGGTVGISRAGEGTSTSGGGAAASESNEGFSGDEVWRLGIGGPHQGKGN